MEEVISYSLSCDSWGDGKRICLWRKNKVNFIKIAMFCSEEAAATFAKEFEFPLSDNVKSRIMKARVAG